jgi:ABC-2 type transport system ATP-binding protein
MTDQSQPLSGHVTVVTGASRGIGRAIAVEFARAGADVVVAARSSESAPSKLPGTVEDTARLLTELGHEVEAVTKDFVLLHRGKRIAHGEVHVIRSLIDEHPHRVVVGTPQPRVLAGALYDRMEVRALEFGKDTLAVLTFAPEKFYAALPELLLKTGVAVTEIHSPDDNLEAVFRFLVHS